MGVVAGLVYGFIAVFVLAVVFMFLGVIGVIVFAVLLGAAPFVDMWGPVKLKSFVKSYGFWLALLFGAVIGWYVLKTYVGLF